MLPSLRKLLVRLRLLSADGYQPFRSRFRLSCITELNSLFARSDHPATHTTQSRPSCITELNSLFASPFTVCCTSLAQRPSSLRELEVALSLHYRNQYHSSKFSPRIWGGNQTTHLISFHENLISFHKNFISHFKTHFQSHLYFLNNRYSTSRPVTKRIAYVLGVTCSK